MDDRILRKIITAAAITKEDIVVEVGPGLGCLTHELAQRARQVIASEIEKKFVTYLQGQLVEPNLEIVHQNILHLSYAAFDQSIRRFSTNSSSRYIVVANLPYAITSAILRYFLDAPNPPSRMVIMVQKEVADRILAKPPRMSLLSVAVQLSMKPTLVTAVPGSAFWPTPEVQSAVLQMEYQPQSIVKDRRLFFSLVQKAFQGKRKQLKTSLKGFHGIPNVEHALEKTQVKPSQRPEELSVADWIQLYTYLFPNIPIKA